MVRTQIQLTEEQARQIKRFAQDEGISVAQLIRRFIDEQLAARESMNARYENAAKLVGAFTDVNGASELSSEHDRFLDEAYES